MLFVILGVALHFDLDSCGVGFRLSIRRLISEAVLAFEARFGPVSKCRADPGELSVPGRAHDRVFQRVSIRVRRPKLHLNLYADARFDFDVAGHWRPVQSLTARDLEQAIPRHLRGNDFLPDGSAGLSVPSDEADFHHVAVIGPEREPEVDDGGVLGPMSAAARHLAHRTYGDEPIRIQQAEGRADVVAIDPSPLIPLVVVVVVIVVVVVVVVIVIVIVIIIVVVIVIIAVDVVLVFLIVLFVVVVVELVVVILVARLFVILVGRGAKPEGSAMNSERHNVGGGVRRSAIIAFEAHHGHRLYSSKTDASVQKVTFSLPNEALDRRPLSLEDLFEGHSSLERDSRPLRSQKEVNPVSSFIPHPAKRSGM
jgi:hypothetical protein